MSPAQGWAAEAAKPDEYAIQLSLSSSLHSLYKAREEFQASSSDPKRAELLKYKLAILEDEVRKKKQRLRSLAEIPRASQWLRMNDLERGKYLRDAHLPEGAVDGITLYVMQYPMDSNLPLADVTRHVARRFARSRSWLHD